MTDREAWLAIAHGVAKNILAVCTCPSLSLIDAGELFTLIGNLREGLMVEVLLAFKNM